MYPSQYDLPIEIAESFDGLRYQLIKDLKEKFEKDDDDLLTAADMCAVLRELECKAPVVIFNHEINGGEWGRHYERFLYWYLNEFWRPFEQRDENPIFLVFFQIVYPVERKQTVAAKLFPISAYRRRRITGWFKKFADSIKFPCSCFLIKELMEIKPDHVHLWIRKHGFSMKEKERIERIEKIFGEKKTLPMHKIEAELEKIRWEYSHL